jgi:hypothetical protein
MRLPKRFFILSLLMLVVSCASLGVFGPREMSYGSAQLQKHLNKRFPRDWSGLGLLNVRLSSPLVEIPETGHLLHLTMDVSAGLGNSKPQPVGRIKLESDLRFDRTEQVVYLDHPRLLASNLNGVGVLGKDANKVATLLVSEIAAHMPIYRADDAYTDGFGREWKLDDAHVYQGKLRVRMVRAED